MEQTIDFPFLDTGSITAVLEHLKFNIYQQIGFQSTNLLTTCFIRVLYPNLLHFKTTDIFQTSTIFFAKLICEKYSCYFYLLSPNY